jgi:predicted DNA repair protein MutK
MASGILAILDDIASLMDDVVVTSKLATKKTAGILGDDLAVNAEKATGYLSSRELPVIWEITKKSLLNKFIIIPLVLLLNFIFPIAIKITLVLGGFFLAYEGAEKIVEYFFPHAAPETVKITESAEDDYATIEKERIKAAVRTDLILSLEIVIIALGTVLDKSLSIQILTVSVVSVIATIGVYGLVGFLVKTDDIGYKLIKESDNKGVISRLGHFLVRLLPIIVKFLSVVGTIALLLVSGGIFAHNIEALHHLFPGMHDLLKEFLSGLIAGLLIVLLIKAGKSIFTSVKK